MPINYFAFQQTYRERRGHDHQSTDDIAEFTNLLNQPGKVYEVLLNDPVRLFVDMDGVPLDKPNLINEFINTFIKFMKSEFNVDIHNYALTCNNGSVSHPGFSYHVYFPEYYLNNVHNCKYILLRFIDYDREHKFYDYIDGCIYHYNRLFRCPNQYNAAREAIDEMDKHNIIKGTIQDCVIQYTSNSQLLNIEFDYNRVKSLCLKNGSNEGETIKLKMEKSKILKKFGELKKNTEYDKFYEHKDKNESKSRNDLISNMIDLMLKYNVDIDRINFDKLDKNELQTNLSRMQWAIGIFEKLIDDLSNNTNNTHNEEDKKNENDEIKSKTNKTDKKNEKDKHEVDNIENKGLCLNIPVDVDENIEDEYRDEDEDIDENENIEDEINMIDDI